MVARRAVAGLGALAGAALLAYACSSDPVTPAASIAAPLDVEVEAVSTTSVRVSWMSSGSQGVTGYDVQRRADLAGPFATVAENIGEKTGRIVWFDNSVEPDRFYGYRVIARAGLGAHSTPSVVGGTKTPPMHGLIITTNTDVPNEGSSDPDGYSATVRGPKDTVTVTLATNGERRISPLKPGTYVAVLRGLAKNCGFKSGDSTKSVVIPDSGVATQGRINYELSCRDPKRGSIVVRYDQQGDTTDANGVRLAIVGLLFELDPVDTSRVYFQQQTITSRAENLRYDNLRKGSYEVTLDDISPLCRLAGTRKRTVEVAALTLDTVAYNLDCLKPPVPEDTLNRPLLVEQVYSPAQAPAGTRVSLLTRIDLRSRPQSRVVGLQTSLGYNKNVLRFDSARVGDFDLLTNNAQTPGIINSAAINTDGRGLGGLVSMGRFWFTVVGTNAATSRTSTTITEIVGPNVQDLKPQTRTRDATFTVGPMSSVNAPPTAKANGPYSGRIATAVQFSSSGSSDSDGSIASYSWTFGDGGTATGASPTHSYSAVGTYTARLTVTDDGGATATDQATVTITANSNQPPVAHLTGPTSGTVGASLSFDGSTSTDSDGTIASYAWDFGDTQSGTGASVAHTYANAGTYTVRLTVTDNGGATHSATQNVVITTSGGSQQPFVWKSEFGTMNPTTKEIDLTISLDLATDIPETPSTEALQSFIVDSLKWNAATLQFQAFNWGPGQAQTIDQSAASSGRVAFTGTTIPANSTGVINIATVRFKAIGAIGATAATVSTVGALIGTPGTGSYNYRVKTRVQEDTFAIPAGAAGTVQGAVLRASNSAAIAGVSVVVTPTGGSALPAAITDASGQYSVPNVPVGDGSVAITGGLPSGCTAPAQQPYTGLTSGGSATVSFSMNCQSQQPGTYPITGAWGSITSGGPTGRQVTLSLSIDMGPAPGRPDVNGSNQDELVGIQLSMTDLGQFVYASRTLPDANLDLGAINSTGPGLLNVAVTSSQSMTSKGLVNFVVLRFNIPTGFTGQLTPTMALTELLAGTFAAPIHVESSGVVNPLPTLTVP